MGEPEYIYFQTISILCEKRKDNWHTSFKGRGNLGISIDIMKNAAKRRIFFGGFKKIFGGFENFSEVFRNLKIFGGFSFGGWKIIDFTLVTMVQCKPHAIHEIPAPCGPYQRVISAVVYGLCMVRVWFVYGLCMVWYVTPDQWFSMKKSAEKKVGLDRVKTRFQILDHLIIFIKNFYSCYRLDISL